MQDSTVRIPIVWNGCGLTDVGTVRSCNEDSILIHPGYSLWAIADGMGGHQCGDIASKHLVESLSKTLYQHDFGSLVEEIENVILEVNDLIFEYSQTHFSGSTMGTTLVALVLKGRLGVCLWAGDSRLYRLRNSQMTQLTADHSYVYQLYQDGLLTLEDMETHPQKNTITRAIGVERPVVIEVCLFSSQVGDTYLLCSDGLYNSVDKETICEILHEREATSAANKLMRQALNNNASDNVSVIVVKGQLDRKLS